MKRAAHKRGFTLVELLTTMAVIGILLAFLVPALSGIQKAAMNVKQKAQFQTISLGIEAFRTDSGYGDYPPSTYHTTTAYTASERLAEAMIGQDGLGFHPSSTFNQMGLADLDGDGTFPAEPLYRNHPDFDTDPYYAIAGNKDANLQIRKGPYLETEGANAVQLRFIYNTAVLGSLRPDSFVLVDMFKKVKHLGTGKQIGMPILYYLADKTQVGHSGASAAAMESSTYNLQDAYFAMNTSTPGIVALPAPFAALAHPMFGNEQWFYDATANPNFTSPLRPYRSDSFILQSAGPDGLYGTPDDIFNFDAGK